MPLHEYSYHFNRFWAEYPLKVGKGAAWKSWQKLTKGEDEAAFAEMLVLHLTERKKTDAKWIEGRYVPQPATFLNQGRWDDEYQKAKPAGRQTGWSGHQPTDEENAIRFVQDQMRRGLPVPPELMKYESAARQGMAH